MCCIQSSVELILLDEDLMLPKNASSNHAWSLNLVIFLPKFNDGTDGNCPEMFGKNHIFPINKRVLKGIVNLSIVDLEKENLRSIARIMMINVKIFREKGMLIE